MAYQAAILDVTKKKEGCCICFGTLQSSELNYSRDNPSRRCDFHDGLATSSYEPMSASGAVLHWHHKGYHLACRACDLRVYGTTNRPITSTGAEEEYGVACSRYVVPCFVCGKTCAPVYQLFVEVDGQTRSRMFACTLEHLEEFKTQLCKMREQNYSEGWCRHCNLIYTHSSHSQPIVFRIRNIATKQPSWIRVASWVAWWNKGVEMGVEERVI